METNEKGFSKALRVLGFKAPVVETRGVDGPAPGVIPPVRDASPTVTVDAALSISSVYRSVSIICTAVSQMPLGVKRGTYFIDTPHFILRPSPGINQRTFLFETMWSLVTTGNAYWRTYGSGTSADPVIALDVLDPNAVTVVIEDGKRVYYLGAERVHNIKHIVLEPRPGQPKGLGPIQRGTAEIAAALRLREFGNKWFGSVPEGVLTTDQHLGSEESHAFAEAWEAFLRDHSTAILSNGMRYEHLNALPKESQYAEVLANQNTNIARLFGVPATLLNTGVDGSSLTYANNQDLFIHFLTTTLVQYINAIEGAFSDLLPRGQFASFDQTSLMRMNTTEQVAVDVQRINAGLATADELRARDGLQPLGLSPQRKEPAPAPVESK